MNEVLKEIGNIGIIPVAKIDDAKDAVPLAKALLAGGLGIIEITFRTDAAEQSIKNIYKSVPEMLIGAGTVLTKEQAGKAISAGAKFIVSPGINPKVVKYCIEKNVPITPGCSNPTDIEVALSLGLDAVKFFPAEAFGGIKTLKAMSAPFGSMKFIPTGGIEPGNIIEYLMFNKVLACGGSWMVRDELIKSGNFAEVTGLTKEAISLMHGFDLAHVGIDCNDANESLDAARKISSIFNFQLKEGNNSNFAGSVVELNKGKGFGKNGHIAIKTNHIGRAIFYLEKAGIAIDISSAKTGPDGSLVAVYLKDEIAGFAFHLLQKK